MILRNYLVALLAVLSLFQSTCFINPNNKEKVNEVDTDMQSVNLYEFDKELNKKNIDVILDKIREYPINCKMSDFSTKEVYADFLVTEVNVYNEDDYDRINAYCRLKTNSKEDDYDVKFNIAFYKSQSENQDRMRNSLNEYTAMEVYPSSLNIGDFAIGDNNIEYIRGNVFVSVTGYDEVVTEFLAREIDQQILDIITIT
jgi:hypothetical protein